MLVLAVLVIAQEWDCSFTISYIWPVALSSFGRPVTRGTYVSDPVCRGRVFGVACSSHRPETHITDATPLFRPDHVPRADERGGDNPIANGTPKQNGQSRRFKSHNPPTPFMESRIPRPLDRPPNRPFHHPPLSHVLCQQLLLHLAV